MIAFMNDCLYIVVAVFRGFPLLTSIFALAILCSIATLIKSFFGGVRR